MQKHNDSISFLVVFMFKVKIQFKNYLLKV